MILRFVFIVFFSVLFYFSSKRERTNMSCARVHFSQESERKYGSVFIYYFFSSTSFLPVILRSDKHMKFCVVVNATGFDQIFSCSKEFVWLRRESVLSIKWLKSDSTSDGYYSFFFLISFEDIFSYIFFFCSSHCDHSLYRVKEKAKKNNKLSVHMMTNLAI